MTTTNRSSRWIVLAIVLLLPLMAACSQVRYKGPSARTTSPEPSVAKAYQTPSMHKAADADNDGVPDVADRCGGSPLGQAVDGKGCTAQMYMKITLRYGRGDTGLPYGADYRLGTVAEILYENPDVRVVVNGHADSQGSATVASQRAQVVKNALMRQYQVPSSRVSVRSHGSSKPLVSNRSESGRARNRRVEMVLTGPYWAPTGDDIPTKAMVINFAASSSVLTPMSRKSLEAIGRYLQAHPDAQARITARHGKNSRVNASLAQARADNILGYLARNYGVEPEQLAVEFLDGPRLSQHKQPAQTDRQVAVYTLPRGRAMQRLMGETATAASTPAQPEGATQTAAASMAGAVCFDPAQAAVRQSDQSDIDAIGKLLSQSPNMRCVLAGHTDSKGSASNNLRLSRQRAEAVKQYLIKNYNIAASQLEVQAFGESTPIASNDTAAGRSQNRRVEFKVMQS